MFTILKSLFLPCLASVLSLSYAQAHASASTPVRIIVLSDLHITTRSKVPDGVSRVIRAVAQMAPAAVVITGDSTSGNRNDRFGLNSARRWWGAVLQALKPLRDAGIAVLPIAGNHDSYKESHRKAYAEAATALLSEYEKKGGTIRGPAPFSYSTELGDVHLSLLDIVDQRLPGEVADWLLQDLRTASPKALKIAFGHVPLFSVMGRTNPAFQNQLGTLLALHGVSAYVAGHEHLFWDELSECTDDLSIRQIIAGTASATYNFGIRKDLRDRYCMDVNCRMPFDGRRFKLSNARDGTQRHQIVFLAIDIMPGEFGPRIETMPLTLDEADRAVSFYELEN